MSQTIATTSAALHPVLVEVVETHLMWVEAETPQSAEGKAVSAVGYAMAIVAPIVDRSIETRIPTPAVADWLDASADEIERLDAYFAARSGA